MINTIDTAADIKGVSGADSGEERYPDFDSCHDGRGRGFG